MLQIAADKQEWDAQSVPLSRVVLTGRGREHLLGCSLSPNERIAAVSYLLGFERKLGDEPSMATWWG